MVALAALCPLSAEDGFRAVFDGGPGWQARPDWLGNESDQASVSFEDGCVRFSVPEANKGLKWSLAFPAAVWIDAHPYLTVRYRAQGLQASGDYFIYLEDGGPKQLSAVRLDQVVPDGEWHAVCVDVTEVAQSDRLTMVAVQVQASEGPATVWISELALSDSPPPGVETLSALALPTGPDHVVPIAPAALWTAEPSWLGNPCTAPMVTDGEGGVAFGVAELGRGMKWRLPLADDVPLSGYRYLSMRYRGRGLAPGGDYSVCVIGSREGDAMDYRAVVGAGALIANGRWQVVSAELRDVAQVIRVARTLAVQVQSAGPDARLEIADIRFTNERQLRRVADAVALEPFEGFGSFVPLDLGNTRTVSHAQIERHLGVSDWFEGPRIRADGIPFELAGGVRDLAATDLRAEESELALPIGRSCAAVYLLLAARMSGNDDPAYGGSRLESIADVDRLLVTLEYADGSTEEQFPWSVSGGDYRVLRGPQVVRLEASPAKELRSLRLCDGSAQTAYYVAAATASPEALAARPVALPLAIDAGPVNLAPGAASLERTADGELTARTRWMEARIDFSNGVRLADLRSLAPDLEWLPGGEKPELLRVLVDGKPVAFEPWACVTEGEAPVLVSRSRAGEPALSAHVEVVVDPVQGLGLVPRITNEGALDLRVGLELMRVPLVAGDAASMGYCFAQRGTLIDSRPTRLRMLSSGLYPLQFVSAFSPELRVGAHLFTRDTEGVDRDYTCDKDDSGVTLGTAYPELTLPPGQSRSAVPTFISILPGDWHSGMAAYRQWLETWYRPQSPRQQWFREVFNFRQRFLYWADPLVKPGDTRVDLQPAIYEARAEFGGIEYLHLFDWGNCGPFGRIYGRTGDLDPGEYLPGGWDGLKSGVEAAQADGVRVGFYIEGYLLEERGELGKARGKEWQLIGADGKGLYWPSSTEMFVCPRPEAWREVQETTYERMVRRMNADGMYMDQFGFAGSDKRCYSPEHGHPVPSFPAAEERGMLERARAAISRARDGAVLYTEEIPTDVNSQFHDGSFTYNMLSCLGAGSRVPISLFRFAVPSFKPIEILYCDKPTASWATGVKWVFFNGEGIWLEGPAREWFAPQTRRAIAKCHGLLREYRDAFTSDQPSPLVPTLDARIHANRFPTRGKVVYTLYNEAYRTVSSDVLAVPIVPGARYYDAWNSQELTPRFEGDQAIIAARVGPRSVGCIAITGEGVGE